MGLIVSACGVGDEVSASGERVHLIGLIGFPEHARYPCGEGIQVAV